MVYSSDRSKAVVLVLVLLFVTLCFILWGDLFYVLPCVFLFMCFSVILALRLPRLGKRELILVLFVRLFDLYLFGFVGFLFLLVSGKGCGLWMWHSLDFSLTLFLQKDLCDQRRLRSACASAQSDQSLGWSPVCSKAFMLNADDTKRLRTGCSKNCNKSSP